jgi:hypothetical protein
VRRRAIAVIAVAATAFAGCGGSSRRSNGTPAAEVRASCADPSSTFIDYAAGAAGDPRSPLEVAESHLKEEGLQRSDELVTTGSAGGESLVGVIRGDETVIVVHLRRADEGGWLVDRISRCPGGRP